MNTTKPADSTVSDLLQKMVAAKQLSASDAAQLAELAGQRARRADSVRGRRPALAGQGVRPGLHLAGRSRAGQGGALALPGAHSVERRIAPAAAGERLRRGRHQPAVRHPGSGHAQDDDGLAAQAGAGAGRGHPAGDEEAPGRRRRYDRYAGRREAPFEVVDEATTKRTATSTTRPRTPRSSGS